MGAEIGDIMSLRAEVGDQLVLQVDTAMVRADSEALRGGNRLGGGGCGGGHVSGSVFFESLVDVGEDRGQEPFQNVACLLIVRAAAAERIGHVLAPEIVLRRKLAH